MLTDNSACQTSFSEERIVKEETKLNSFSSHFSSLWVVMNTMKKSTIGSEKSQSEDDEKSWKNQWKCQFFMTSFSPILHDKWFPRVFQMIFRQCSTLDSTKRKTPEWIFPLTKKLQKSDFSCEFDLLIFHVMRIRFPRRTRDLTWSCSEVSSGFGGNLGLNFLHA